MPTVCLTLPYARTSPLHIPRRDLVLASADSLYLRVTVVDSDRPGAQLLELTGGIGGPGAQLAIWADWPGRYHDDYGMARPACRDLLWSVVGVPLVGSGAFDFALSSGVLAGFPRRCGWSVQLNYDTQGADVLMAGSLHVRHIGAAFGPAAMPHLLTDTYQPIHTDTEEHLLA